MTKTFLAVLAVVAATTLTVTDVADAKLERVFAPPLRARWLAPLAAERLRQEARREGRTPAVIQSTLDAGLQVRLEQLLTDRLSSLPDTVSMAALVVDNRTLEVRGYVGSADFTDDRRGAHVDMVRARRSPGSTLKPFLYAMALDDGLIHSESLLIDAPQNFGGYAPGNFQADFSGPVSVSEALQRSLNVPAVDLLDRIGPERFAGRLRNAGVKLRMPANAAPNLSLILGGGSTTLEELVGAYTALARGGVAARPHLTPLPPDTPLHETRLMSEGAAFIVREILENGGRPGNPFRESGQRVAWKTGTSFGFRDAWALGVTDRYTFGVWIGRPDGTPNPGHFGANSAAPLLRDLAAALGPGESRQQLAPRRQPASVAAVPICWPQGGAESATEPGLCLQHRTAWTLDGAVPPTLPDRLRPWVQDVADRMQCPPDFVAVPMVAAAGNLIGRRCAIRPQAFSDWQEFPNLWGCIVGRPGMMKSPAMMAALAPVVRLEARALEEWTASQGQWRAETEIAKARAEARKSEATKALRKNPDALVDVASFLASDPDDAPSCAATPWRRPPSKPSPKS